ELESYSKFFELHSVESKYYDFIKIGDNKSRIYKLSVIEEILINLKDGVYTLDNIYYDYYELLELNGINSKALFKNLIEELPENDKRSEERRVGKEYRSKWKRENNRKKD